MVDVLLWELTKLGEVDSFFQVLLGVFGVGHLEKLSVVVEIILHL